MADKTSIIKEAQKYLAKGQVDKAISEWEKLIKEYPDGNTYNTIGDLYLKKGDKKNAVDSYQKAANFFRHEGFSLKALALYKKVLNIDQNDANALYSLGELSEKKGLITDAIKYYLATADSYIKDRKKDKVLDIYEKILSLSPANIPLRNKVAEIFLKEGLKSDASKEYIHVAKLYEEKGDVQKSKEYYQKVLDLQPLNKEAVIGIGHLYEKMGDVDNAVEQMKEATALFPEDSDIILRYAELSLIKGNTDIAKECLQRLVEKDPTDMQPRRLLGEIYLKGGLKEEAWGEYLPVIDGMILEGKYDDAIKLLESFKEVDPIETGKRLVSLYRQLGENAYVAEELKSMADVLYERGMNDEALSCYREALDITPEDGYLRGKIDKMTQVPELEKEPVEEHVAIKGEKTADEILTEADIFFRYGLLSEAKRLLEGLKLREPQNIEVHMRLKSVYGETSDKEAFVTECLILNELFRRLGDIENSEKMLKDGYEIYPEDPRLVERAGASLIEPTAFGAPEREEFVEPAVPKPSLEDYEEEIAEADFYAGQGLMQEAVKILEKLHGLFPEDAGIAEKLDSLGRVSGISEMPEVPETAETPVETLEFPEVKTEEAAPKEEIYEEEIKYEEEVKEEIEQKPEEKVEYEDFMITDQDLMEAQEMPEPTLDNDVLEIFQEFKKGLEKELGDEDSETHYNLGIAYKEMGLVDDAIKEFQTARNDPKRFIQCSTMLGICYMEKGLYSLAMDVLNAAIKNVDKNDETYWAIKYELAEANEKSNNLKEALDLYTEVYGRNARFRNVSDKMNSLRTMLAKSVEKEKPKERKDRVSYL